MRPTRTIEDDAELRDLAAFFLWGGWICAAQRPGLTHSYTHNWPYEPLAGNVPTAPTLLWSVIAVLALVLGTGIVLYGHGRPRPGVPSGGEAPPQPLTLAALEQLMPTALQRRSYGFFLVVGLLFAAQILCGVLTVHDFVGFTSFFGFDLARVLPITVTRSLHVQLALFWIMTAWIGASVFLVAELEPRQPRHQETLARVIAGLLLVVVAGTCGGLLLGPAGVLGPLWRELGQQGWEYLELGRLWQALLFVALVLWAIFLVRALRPTIRRLGAGTPPFWLLFAVCSVVVLFLAGFVAGASDNFVVADFWRWMVVHMWVEAFFEVVATILIGFMLRSMGLVTRESAQRAATIAVILFLGSGLLGIAHNFYWNAKPVEMLALGSVFSTLQVVPLIRLMVEAWRYRRLPAPAPTGADAAGSAFAHAAAYRFLTAVMFWNFFGAGVLGFTINLPIVNYYEHGTYLTVNHGHAAFFGVYGNLAIALIIFCSRYLVRPAHWPAQLMQTMFWALNVGLLLMLGLDTLPAGFYQLDTVLESGYWAARSQAFIHSEIFQTLTWSRIVGGALFTLGGVLPLSWFLMTRRRLLR